jgi:hypothetical protein
VAAEHRVLGILAGGGQLPGQVAAAARAAGRSVFLIGLEGFAEPAVLAPWPHEMVRILAAGRIIAALREHGCQDLVLVGPVRRPSLLDLRPDAEAARILARIGRAAFAGDDGLLAAVVRIFAEEGFRVLGAHEILHEALGPAGRLSQAVPDAVAMADIRRGIAVARALGAMLARCASLARPGRGGVLVKLVKPGQDRRTDLPTIGPETLRGATAAGLRGVAFEAGGTILAERDAAIAAADEAGLFLLGLSPNDLSERGEST